MNSNAKKWVAALRSGEWKQGKTKLNINNEMFCCLGVACELFMQDENNKGVLTKRQIHDNGVIFYYGDSDYIGFCGSLPQPVQDWLGMTSSNGKINSRGLSLANRNDNGDTFAVIADIIETHQNELFATECHFIP